MTKKDQVISRALSTNEDKRMLREELSLIWNKAMEWYKGGNILEVGAYKGMTSYVLAGIIDEHKKKGKLYISDTFDSNIGDNSWEYEEHTEEMLLENVGEYKKYIKLIPGETLKNKKEITKRKYDFTWHDGDHSYPNFLEDLLMIDELTDHILIHDYGHPFVTQSADEFCQKKGYKINVLAPGKFGLAEVIK